MRLDGTLIPQAVKAGEAGDWSELLESDKLNAWTSAKLQECHSEVKQEDDERKSIVQQIMPKSKAHYSASRRTGRGHVVLRVSSLSALPA